MAKETTSRKDSKKQQRKQFLGGQKRTYEEQKRVVKGKYVAKLKVQKKQETKVQKAAEVAAERKRAQEEKAQRIEKYKQKRLERTKAISKRTQRGQPLMKDRMQLLLKQIQEMKRS